MCLWGAKVRFLTFCAILKTKPSGITRGEGHSRKSKKEDTENSQESTLNIIERENHANFIDACHDGNIPPLTGGSIKEDLWILTWKPRDLRKFHYVIRLFVVVKFRRSNRHFFWLPVNFRFRQGFRPDKYLILARTGPVDKGAWINFSFLEKPRTWQRTCVYCKNRRTRICDEIYFRLRIYNKISLDFEKIFLVFFHNFVWNSVKRFDSNWVAIQKVKRFGRISRVRARIGFNCTCPM